MTLQTPPAAAPAHAPAWSPATETREDVKALLLRRTSLDPGERLLFREIFPAIYKTYLDTLRCVARSRGATDAVEKELAHEALFKFWHETCAAGFPNSIQAKLLALAGGFARNHVRDERLRRGEELPTSSKEEPGSLGKPERVQVTHELAHQLYDRLSPEHQEVIAAVFFGDETVADVARRLGFAHSTVSDRLTAALTLLAAMAEEFLTESERCV